MDRKQIREMTMQLIYQMDATGDFDYEHLSVLEENMKVLNKPQALTVLNAVRDHINDIDGVISACLDKWTIDRVSRTDLAIIRTAVCEMMFADGLPSSISINEAVRMSHKYGDDKSYAFVNSVLGKAEKYLSEQDK